MNRLLTIVCFLAIFPMLAFSVFAEELTLERVTEIWKNGETLPESVFEQYKLPQGRPSGQDTGINVLFDLNRRCNFVWLWEYQGQFARNGFRVCGTQATLDTVLGPNAKCRVRVKTPDAEPFAWWTPPQFNAVVIPAGSPNQQQFTKEEIETLKEFAQNGGGIVFIAETPANEQVAAEWSFNTLLREFDAAVLPQREQVETGSGTALKLGADWESLLKGENGATVRARRVYEKGRIMIVENDAALCYRRASREQGRNEAARKTEEDTRNRLVELMTWVTSGKAPVGGSAVLPQPRAGGGGIFPDQEMRTDGIVAYYAKNQIPDLLKVVEEDLPEVTEHIYQWLPSEKPDEPIMFILSAGSGGGWAVNVRLPKEVGIISDDRLGIISIFAHEQAHTMRGPRNEKGTYGPDPAHDLSGEAHAGWFQGKADAVFSEKARSQSNRNCNSILNDRERFLAFDFVKHFQKQGTGFPGDYGWRKLWWVWQKLDDRYGTTWYPRWYWVRATRWQDENQSRRQTWEETIEDMSIAVGEDLFPFFKEIGTELSKERFSEVQFQGKTLSLPIAEIELSPAGNVHIDPVGDYKQPLKK